MGLERIGHGQLIRPFDLSVGDIHKRVPQRPAAALTDIYVSQKSKIPVIVKRIRQLMMSER
jgi:hypothetical protein